MRLFSSFVLCDVLICFLILLNTDNIAQENGNSKIDSLHKERLDVLGIQDTILANDLLQGSVDSFKNKKFQESFRLADSARLVFEKLLGKHEKTAQATNQMGRAKFMLSEMEDAILFFKNAGDIQRIVNGEKSKEVAQAYANLGIAYFQLGKVEQSLVYHKKALDIKLEILGSEDPLVVQSYNSIGRIYEQKGAYIQALEYYKKGREIIQVQGQVVDLPQ